MMDLCSMLKTYIWNNVWRFGIELISNSTFIYFYSILCSLTQQCNVFFQFKLSSFGGYCQPVIIYLDPPLLDTDARPPVTPLIWFLGYLLLLHRCSRTLFSEKWALSKTHQQWARRRKTLPGWGSPASKPAALQRERNQHDHGCVMQLLH